MKSKTLLLVLTLGLAFTFASMTTRSALAVPPKLMRRAKTPVTWVKSFFQTRKLRRSNPAADRAYRKTWKGTRFVLTGKSEGRDRTIMTGVGAVDTAFCAAAIPSMPVVAIPMTLMFGKWTAGFEGQRESVVAKSRVSSMVGAIKDGVRVDQIGSTAVQLHRRALREALRDELKQAKGQTTFRRVGTALSTLDKARRTDTHRLAAQIIKGSRLGVLAPIRRHLTDRLWASEQGNRVSKDELVNELVSQRDFLIQAQQRSQPRKVADRKIARVDKALKQLFKKPWGIKDSTFVRVAKSGALAKTTPKWRGDDTVFRVADIRASLKSALKRTDQASDPVGHRNLAEALTVIGSR